MALEPISLYSRLDMRKFIGGSLGHATDQSHPTFGAGTLARSYWTRRRFHGDVEVWAYPYGGQLGAALETWRLFIWGPNPARDAYGYLVYIGGGIGKDTVIRRYDGADSWTSIGSHGGSYANGLMLRVLGDNVEVWACDFGDDPDDPANWYQRISVVDTTYRGPYYIGMAIEDPSNGGLSFTGFGGGKPIPQKFIRYVSN